MSEKLDNKSTLALFDFDGTITTKDTFIEFLKYYKGASFFYFSVILFSPILVLYKMGIVSNTIAKQVLFSFYFKGIPQTSFELLCQEFTKDVVNGIIKPVALKKIQDHQEKGHRVIIVSAGIHETINYWADMNNVELLATEPAVKEKYLTGHFSTLNCYGIEKVNRIKKYVDITKYNSIFAYGDSKGDKQMLELANYPFYKPF